MIHQPNRFIKNGHGDLPFKKKAKVIRTFADIIIRGGLTFLRFEEARKKYRALLSTMQTKIMTFGLHFMTAPRGGGL